MGPVNWIAIVAGAMLAAALGWAWYGPLFGRGQGGLRPMGLGWSFVAMLVCATMMGHNFARVGHDTLAHKPWLYWMMTGGLAWAIVWPALGLTLGRRAVPKREIIVEGGYWMAAFLIMGTVFWAFS